MCQIVMRKKTNLARISCGEDDRAVCMCVSVCLCVRVRLSVPDGVSGAFARISFLIKARGGDLGSNCLRVSKRFLIY